MNTLFIQSGFVMNSEKVGCWLGEGVIKVEQSSDVVCLLSSFFINLWSRVIVEENNEMWEKRRGSEGLAERSLLLIWWQNDLCWFFDRKFERGKSYFREKVSLFVTFNPCQLKCSVTVSSSVFLSLHSVFFYQWVTTFQLSQELDANSKRHLHSTPAEINEKIKRRFSIACSL